MNVTSQTAVDDKFVVKSRTISIQTPMAIRARPIEVEALFEELPPNAREAVMDPRVDEQTVWFYGAGTMHVVQRDDLFIACWAIEGVSREHCSLILDAIDRLAKDPQTKGRQDLVAQAVASFFGGGEAKQV
jgi:hypothetical protein